MSFNIFISTAILIGFYVMDKNNVESSCEVQRKGFMVIKKMCKCATCGRAKIDSQ